MHRPILFVFAAGFGLATLVVTSCRTTEPDRVASAAAFGTSAHRDLVMTSAFCGTCHPAIYAEHNMNTHGRAFTDEEVRLATGRFDHGDCIRCHTPRPVFETGIGLNPIRRYHGLEEGNTCMTCHWKAGVDYSAFQGGAECLTAFDPRVGEVEACASCHRNHGTPYQWEKAPTGKLAGRTCMTCHMEVVVRPVAVGQPPRPVRSHVFPGARNEAHVRRAYDYEAKIEGNQVVVSITNKGAGHHFPTELKQRSVESLIIVRDVDGEEVSRSRMVFRDPYKRPYGLKLPVNTQIKPGDTQVHRVPLKVASGTVETELHFKHYFPIEDNHPDLARRLELRKLVFDGVTPSDEPVESAPEVRVVVPEGATITEASVANLVDFARPPIGKTEITVPDGEAQSDIDRLIELFQFPVPEGNRLAQERLVAIGLPAVPSLIRALGSWDNKTFKQAMGVLEKIGTPAVPSVRDALSSDELYIRYHARSLLERMPIVGDKRDLVRAVLPGLSMTNAMDRRSTAELLGALGAVSAIPDLRLRLRDEDPDVVVAAAEALARLADRDSVPELRVALESATYDETRRALAQSLGELGSPAGIPILLAGLDHRDDLIREDFFESLFAVTGEHQGYDPMMPRFERLAAIARLERWWAENGGAQALRRPYRPSAEVDEHAWHLVSAMGGGAGVVPAAEDDEPLIEELVGMGRDALPALIRGLKFPPGFAAKRAAICTALYRMGAVDAAPFLAAVLRDPVLGVAGYACQALETCGDPEALPALRRFQARILSTAAGGDLPPSIPRPDGLLAQVARTRLLLGDEAARVDLVNLLLSDDVAARRTAIVTLEQEFGETKGYDPEASLDERRAAAARWTR